MDLNLFLSGLPKSKGPGRRPTLVLEILEDRTTPSTMHLGVGHVLHGLNLGATLARLESIAHGHAHPIQELRTMAHDAIQTLTTLSHDLTSAAGQLGSATGLTPEQLTTLLTGVQNSLSTAASALTSILPAVTHMTLSNARQVLSSALADVTTSLGAISGDLTTLAGQLTGPFGSLLGGTAPLLGTVLTNQAGILNTLGSSLNSLGGALPGLAQTRLNKAS
jgi:hypothetical protein